MGKRLTVTDNRVVENAVRNIAYTLIDTADVLRNTVYSVFVNSCK